LKKEGINAELIKFLLRKKVKPACLQAGCYIVASKPREKSIMIKKEEIIEAQKAWGNAIVKIGSLRKNRTLYEKEAEVLIGKLYAVHEKKILFKPSKATIIQFRENMEAAKSYFIGGDKNFLEDKGFALHPWKKVRFKNSGIILEENRAIAMGNYFFTDLNNKEIKIEFTLGYFKNTNGEIKIDLHHSSFPYYQAK